ncbi:S-layer homology domain-containing protein [Demequina sp. NBRC 110057]|uniref:S-layer homology domain-containing protein n=1 Tax=Demequina sp. NBRC 110057 TaxID=1570346 RepID=UPI000A0429CE|nr:S-layer homology domain-containing protein [Demequina sp. NBRC 110057]
MTWSSRVARVSAVLVILLGVSVASPAAPAQAASKFDAGMIISDQLFYDSKSMTATQVQAFLDKQVPTCHPEKDSNPADVTCLKDYRQRTTKKSADAFCDGYAVKTQTAAQIIDGVARSCGISQKVLLVILQKEQSLVTHDWPSSFRYDKAMGYACPDTAPCDTQYSGFFNQVYMAAKQFKRYQANPNNYGYRAGRTNVISYYPNKPSCGTANVYIENQATAALYIYTPYVPNAAALAAGLGSGNSCSSYGNRNFFLFYTKWFGPTEGVSLYPRLADAYSERGGEAALGAPIAAPVWVAANGGGWYQKMAKGTLYLTRSGIDTFRTKGYAVSVAYDAAGGPGGAWGWPIADTRTFEGVPLVEFQRLRVAQIDGKAVTGYPFTDVSDNRNSYDYAALSGPIFWMAREDISQGWKTKYGYEFRRRAPVTRDVMAAFLYRYADGKPAGGTATSFTDVPSTTTFRKEILWLSSTGISRGWETSTGTQYRPSAKTTREQMAAFLFRLAAPEDYVAPAKSPFVDVKTSSTFYREISWLASQGISEGWETAKGAEFRPGQAITREEMAAFLQRLDALG